MNANIPKKATSDARMWGKPVFMDTKMHPDAKVCKNCGDRGVMVAFFAEYDQSSRSGDQPPPCFGKIESKDYDKDGSPIYYQRVATYIKTAWWVGFWKSYTCPICKGDVSRIRGEDVPMPDYIKRQFVGLAKEMKIPARKRQPVGAEA